MIQTVKRIIRTSLNASGAVKAIRRLKRRNLRILMYHRFSPDTKTLVEQCEHMRRYYQPVSLTSISESLETGRPLPHNSIAITIDDGYRDFFLYAYSVFLEYQIPVTVFLVSDFLDEKLWLWWDQIEYAFQQTSEMSISLPWPNGEIQQLALDTQEQKLQASILIVDALTAMENTERLKLIGLIPNLLGVELPASPPPEVSPLRWSEVREMRRAGVEFGAHTKTHPILSRIFDADAIREEIEGSKLRIENQLGEPVLHFSYPNGKVADINKQVVDAAKRAGFRTAVTSERGLDVADADPFLLRRVGVEPVGATLYFQELLAGIIDARGAKPRYNSLP